jgi:hypothetical protein
MSGRYVGSQFVPDAPKTQMQAAGILGIYNDPKDPFVLFAQTTDPVRKAGYLMDIQKAMGPDFVEMQNLLRKSGLSKSTTPLGVGVVGLDESAAIEKLILSSISSQLLPLDFLKAYNSTVKPKKGPAQPDMTTQYTKQIQTALQFKDLGDARQYYNNAYFTAFGQWPAPDLDKKFQDSWNAQVKSQNQPTTTNNVTEKGYQYDTKSKPVIDPKTGKQKVDKLGQKVYSVRLKNDQGQYLTKTKVVGTTSSQGEGFTTEEQTQFLSDFLVENFPEASWNVDDIGGSAKTIYDTIKAYHTGNYDVAPDFATVSPLIKNLLSNPDEQVQNELYNQYISEIQAKSGSRFMAIQNSLKPGETANKYVAPVLQTLSAGLETNVGIKDPLAIQVLNFKDESGEYRLPNEFEMQNIIKSDKRYESTSTAINTAVNMAQSLKNALG